MKRKLTSLALVAVLLTATIAQTACTPKTTTHKLAIFTAQATAAIAGVTDAVELLQTNGKIAATAAKSVYNINLRAALALDTVRNRAETGFNKKETLEIVKQLILDVRAAEAAGLVGLTGNARQKFQEITFFAVFTLESIQAIVDATKEPAVPEGEVLRALQAPGLRQRAEDTVWTDLVLILQKAVLKGLSLSRLDAKGAFDEGKIMSEALKVNLRAKLAV